LVDQNFKNSKEYRRFWKTKSELKNRLLTSFYYNAFSLNVTSKYDRNKVKAIQLYSIGRILGVQGFKKVESKIIKRALEISIKSDQYGLAILCLERLISYYSIKTIDEKLYMKFRKMIFDFRKIEHNEFKSWDHYYNLSFIFLKKKFKKGDYINYLIKASNELTLVLEERNSFKFYKNTYSILSTRYIFEKEYDKVINNSENALKYFESIPIKDNFPKYAFNVDKIIAYILQNENEKADLLVEVANNYVKDFSYNYYNLMFYKFFNYSLWRRYDEMYGLVQHVLKSSKIKNLTHHHQKWKIREAYVRFLLEAGKVSLPADEVPKKFRLARFLNDVPIYTKEKRGYNISILVVQMLFYIARRNYGHVIDRIDALKQYTFKYLRDDETYRSNCFIKMLIKIPGANFHPARTKLHTRDLELKLRAREVTVEELFADIEIIPYHDLWDIILEVLEANWNAK
jgi:hypothetical protein